VPTWDPQRRLRRDEVPEVVAGSVLPPDARRDAQGVGLEVEFLPVRRGPAGTARVPLGSFDDPGTVRGTVARVARTSGLFRDPSDPSGLADGGRVTFEPGGQVELSARCADTPAAALAELQPLTDALADGFGREGISLVSVGFDVWHDVAEVPQQLTQARYPAMATYLARRSPAGALMMRHTASLQVNLDGGAGDVLRARWAVANLVAPVVTATFANSPDPAGGAVSRRARLWQELDPTRTGVPLAFREGGDDPVVAP
jgi:glutamate--cysteine ligase